MKKDIVGIVGPSGVGKGYSKEGILEKYPGSFVEPTVATTRPKRLTDGPDRRAGLSISDFNSMVETGEVVFAHQPFGEGTDWYGFVSDDLNPKPDKVILTEVHVDNVEPFRHIFKDRLLLVGLAANNEYLRANIGQRGTETEEEIALRVQAAQREVALINKFAENELIDEVMHLNVDNRDVFRELMIQRIAEYIF